MAACQHHSKWLHLPLNNYAPSVDKDAPAKTEVVDSYIEYVHMGMQPEVCASARAPGGTS